jgi:hypothetical protein
MAIYISNETWPDRPTVDEVWASGTITSGTTIRIPIQDQVWYSWSSAGTTTPITSISYQEVMWNNWTRLPYSENVQTELDRQYQVRPYQPTQAELDRQQRQREENSRRQLARAARMEGAHDKALELLELVLTAEEQLWRALHQEVMVRGSDGGMYVVEERGVHGNIRQVDEHGCVLARLCVAPRMYEDHPELGHIGLPDPDGWVGQILALKFNESHLREKANFSYRQGCQQPNVPILERVA